MEKRTILAIVISLAIIIVYYVIISVVSPPKPTPIELTRPLQSESVDSAKAEPSRVSDGTTIATAQAVQATAAGDTASALPRRIDDDAGAERLFTINTNLIEAVFTNAGGDLVSFILKEHRDGDTGVDMILRGDAEPHALAIAFGGQDAPAERSIFHTRQLSDTELEFSATFELQGSSFTLTKKYTFVPDEYMFKLSLTIDGEGGGGRKNSRA
ncbi:MAG: membrane protein insertase YidC [Spirochaetaceae bacterium]|jgi:YidC/Oxa1 family membrane protein insertase|nr:membrane protein insertase YidC [Spirochaetaceae bacterium]